MAALHVNPQTGTVTDTSNGKVLFFGLEDFIDTIIKGNNCFICGKSPGNVPFNEEHVIPDWILKRYRLQKEKINLPNETGYRYGSYTVPCCAACNSLLGNEIEGPISALLAKPIDAITVALTRKPNLLYKLFTWLNLVYLKTHLKDNQLPYSIDRRKKDGLIGDKYDWRELHHIHCMARTPYTGAIVGADVPGSILILPALIGKTDNKYYYADHADGRALMIRLGNTCILSVLNDSGFAMSAMQPFYSTFTGPLIGQQLKEVFCHMVYLNINLKERPAYRSFIKGDKYHIEVTLPEKPSMLTGDEAISSVGELLAYYIEKMLPLEMENRDQILDEIRTGKRSYLFNEKGEFIHHTQEEADADAV